MKLVFEKKSSWIKDATFVNATLTVNTIKGKTYTYENVNEKLVMDWQTADSVGSYFIKTFIKTS